MEASAVQAPSSPIRARLSIAMPLLRLRSDEQLVTLFRSGHDEAFRVIHDRYRQRLTAYTRHMLPRPQDAEDALQDVFVRVYTGLRASDDGVANLRPWLYRTAHNRCIDELRRPPAPPPEVLAEMRSPTEDPIAQVVARESLRRVLRHVQQLPAQQRSALLLRELDGAHYADIAIALGTTVPAVKSLLVRARMTLASSLEACDTPCSTIREELTLAHDRGVRPSATLRAHLSDCSGCRDFRQELRGTSRQLAGLVPAIGPFGVLANALGLGGAGSGAIGGGALASGGILSGGHIATLIAAAVATAGGAVAVQNTIMGLSRAPATTPRVIPSSPPNPVTPGVSAPARPAAPAPRIGATPRAATPTRSAALRPRPAVTTTPTIPSSRPGTTPPPASSTGSTRTARRIPNPIRQPSITSIDAVSTTRAAPVSAIGHTSITGIDDVSTVKPSGTSHSGDGSGTSTSTTTSASSGSTSPTGSGSQSSTTQSSQTTGSGPSTGTAAPTS